MVTRPGEEPRLSWLDRWTDRAWVLSGHRKVGHQGVRGSILLEVILAVAIFTAAALVVLRQVSFASDAVQRARDQERAADLARSAMAMIEAGLETPETLSGPISPARVAYGLASATRTAPTAETFANWEMTVEVNPSPFEGLSKVRVTAVWGAGGAAGAERARFSLAQLVRLGGREGGAGNSAVPSSEGGTP